jgi:glycosyltransferase involved in cell wall biosynthesis
MRILHFNQFGSNAGGAEGYVADVSVALAMAGHASRLVSLSPNESGELMPGTVQAAGSHIRDALAGIERAIADFRPDVAYVHAVYEFALVQWIARRLPTVAYVHSPYLVCPGYAQYLRTSSRVCPFSAGLGCLIRAQTERCCFGRNPIRHWRRLHKVRSLIATYQGLDILVGSRFMQALLERNHLNAGRIHILAPFLVDAPPTETAAAPDHKTILYAGRIVFEKGLSHLIRALASVRQEWRLVVAGDGEGRAGCESLARDLGVAERICFLGWLDRPRLGRIYRDSSFAVIPSLWPEPFGRIGPEAATHGRAAIAFDVGGVSDWLVDGATGYLVPPGDTHVLNERIRYLLDSPARQIEMGRQAREMALERWSSAEHADQLLRHLLAAQG